MHNSFEPFFFLSSSQNLHLQISRIFFYFVCFTDPMFPLISHSNAQQLKTFSHTAFINTTLLLSEIPSKNQFLRTQNVTFTSLKEMLLWVHINAVTNFYPKKQNSYTTTPVRNTDYLQQWYNFHSHLKFNPSSNHVKKIHS